jgi:hypothetical protein
MNRYLTKRITICEECGLEWAKPFWEPKWLSRLAAAEIHPDYHVGELIPERHELVLSWREWERERIIALLEADDYLYIDERNAVIALINGEHDD